MEAIVIIAGGRGERFWPKSRAGKPKQFTDLTGKGSMLFLTYQRVAKMVDPERIFVVTGQEYREITRQNLPDLPEQNIIVEPEGRNTAPCIGLTAVILEHRFPGATMVVVPADHLIKEDDLFVNTLKRAVELAGKTGGLVTLGIRPTRPETGYGYLRTGEEVPLGQGETAYKVSSFVEKPDVQKAERFLSEGGYLWNAGIFIWQVPVILGAFKTHLPDIYEGLLKIGSSLGTPEYTQVLTGVYPSLQKISVDFGIMEKVDQVYTVPGEFSWDDVGSWRALERVFGTDTNGNVLLGNILALDSTNCIIETCGRMVAAIGLEDLVVVETEDITFICPKDKTDRVRELLASLSSQNMEKYL